MRTVQMTLEDALVKSVDLVVKKLHTTRSAFTRLALKKALRNLKIKQLEQQHRLGYQAHPPSGKRWVFGRRNKLGVMSETSGNPLVYASGQETSRLDPNPELHHRVPGGGHRGAHHLHRPPYSQ